MSLFCWYLDMKFSNDGKSTSFNEFSYYHFFGYSQNFKERVQDSIYIKEENSYSHFNVYKTSRNHNNNNTNDEKFDILPVFFSIYLVR